MVGKAIVSVIEPAADMHSVNVTRSATTMRWNVDNGLFVGMGAEGSTEVEIVGCKMGIGVEDSCSTLLSSIPVTSGLSFSLPLAVVRLDSSAGVEGTRGSFGCRGGIIANPAPTASALSIVGKDR